MTGCATLDNIAALKALASKAITKVVLSALHQPRELGDDTYVPTSIQTLVVSGGRINVCLFQTSFGVSSTYVLPGWVYHSGWTTAIIDLW
jgi:hypothetical protein